ncbi:hypothetical protein OPW32_25045, partial [Vibrio europaeus]|uniref:hypothetical protein n=1 Tax=Vibrio europaeus TaxID=300876 RepID=UPI00234104B6
SHLAAPEPKSGASTNSATSASILCSYRSIGENHMKLYGRLLRTEPGTIDGASDDALLLLNL